METASPELSMTIERTGAPQTGARGRLRSVLAFTRVALRDRPRATVTAASAERHLLAAESWLCRAHDVATDGGVSYGYTLRRGWGPSYPETSGYIATTFLRLAEDRHPDYATRAERVLHWLMRIQNDDGSFANPRYGRQGIVFDTGQVLFGLVRGYEVGGDPALLAAARRAANWLVDIADRDLRWTRNEHLDTPHVYNARSAWALLRMNQIEADPRREAVARSNLDWAVEEQRPSGFFDHCSFARGDAPFTHTIAYTTRGLLESALLLDDSRYLDAAERSAQATMRHLRADGHLPSTISIAGDAMSTSCCLTGNCQFALVWGRLFEADADPRYRTALQRALDFVMTTQDVETKDLDVRGGIRGSEPAWGRYAWMSYPNWATKFFIDAMWLRRRLEP